MKKILFVGSEVMPFAATGGLGDVLGSLPKTIAKESADKVEVSVIMPLYNNVSELWRDKMELVCEYEVTLSWRKLYCGIKKIVSDGVSYYFVDNQYYFYRESMYGSFDDGERFAFFSKAVLDFMRVTDYFPNVLHTNDWHSALVNVYLRTLYAYDERYSRIKSIFTIHNIEYQGQFDLSMINDVFSFDHHDIPILEYDGRINLMKAAIVTADIVSTVSPRYADEILEDEYSHRLYHILRQNKDKLVGILNGIDYEYYDPSGDKEIAECYSWRSIKRKSKNKKALEEELGLPVAENSPMISIVSRLASHKGIDLVADAIYNIVKDNNIQLVILGKGEGRYEDLFCRLQDSFPEKVRALITYDRALSKRIYAATDIFLMPSKSEPCGLSQMIASRYGAIPVVRETGGLYDSIKQYREENGKILGNGITFVDYTAQALSDAVNRALLLYHDEEKRTKLISRIMRTDFSWKASASKYLELYDII